MKINKDRLHPLYDQYSNDENRLTHALLREKGYHVSQVVIVSNEFTEDFISECEYDYELSISLISSDGLLKILEGLKESSLAELPVRLLLKDGALNADRIVKVLNR